MIRLAIILLCSLFSTSVGASDKIYLDYSDNACMSRYEYRLTGAMLGNGYIVYHIFKNEFERVALEVGVENIANVARKPQGTISCKQMNISEDLVRRINAGLSEVYIVRQNNFEYNISKVSLASFSRVIGTRLQHEGPDFSMSYAMGELVGADNLAVDSSKPSVYFQGEEPTQCQQKYSFRKIPVETCKPYTNFSYVPKIGVVEETTGLNDEHASKNKMTLVKINNHLLEDYMQAQCNGSFLTDAYLEKVKTITPPPVVIVETVAVAPPPAKVVVEDDDLLSKSLPETAPPPKTPEPPKPQPEVKAPVKIVCSRASSHGIHVVQQEETLFSIARKNGITVEQLKAWNKIPVAENVIKPCTALYTLAPSGYEKPVVLPKKEHRVINKKPTVAAVATTPPKKKTIPKIEPPKTSTHIVRKGESLGSIACMSDMTLEQIMRLNKLTSEKIYVGQELLVTGSRSCPATELAIEKTVVVTTPPMEKVEEGEKEKENGSDFISRSGGDDEETKITASVVGRTHTVKQGENLYSISRAYGTTVEKIQQLNGLDDPTKLDLNQVLKID